MKTLLQMRIPRYRIGSRVRNDENYNSVKRRREEFRISGITRRKRKYEIIQIKLEGRKRWIR